MRKVIIWVLAALMALSGIACAEEALVQPAHAAVTASVSAATTSVIALNGADAVRTASELYMVIPSLTGEMLVRVPFDGGAPVCMDRADSIDGLINYGGGLVYLKTTDGSSAIMSCSGSQVSSLYSFGAAQASCLSYYNGKLMVLMDGLLHSVEPDTAVCLKLSGAQMLDYVVGQGYAYYLAGGDQMEYTAQLGDGETASAQAGCIYRLDLNSGESDLLLKSGGEDVSILGDTLYFHNLADAYAVRTSESAALKGRVYSLNAQSKTLESECAEPDSGFWPLDAGVVAWYDGALNLDSAAGVLNLYSPENGSTVASDGDMLYVWEPAKLTLTELRTTGTATVLYTGDLTQAGAVELSTPVPAAEPTATVAPEGTIQPSSDWFQNFMNNQNNNDSSSSSSGSGAVSVKATPIGYATPTPAPVVTVRPNSGSSSTSGGSSSSSSGSGSSSSSSGPAIYNTSISRLKVTGDVNMRSEPKASSSKKCVIPAGTVVECAGKYAKYSNGSKWYKVEYNGKTGWVYANYVTQSSSSSSGSDNPTGSTTEVATKYIRIVGGKCNIRSSASKDSKSKGVIPNGAVATSLGVAKTDSRGVKWYKIKYDGVTGWVSSQYGQPSNDGSSSSGGESTATRVHISGGDCSIRSKANKDSTRVGVIGEGKSATYLGKSSKDSRGVVWYKIKYNGVTGWVSSRYADLYD